jgi:hypothetical protein
MFLSLRTQGSAAEVAYFTKVKSFDVQELAGEMFGQMLSEVLRGSVEKLTKRFAVSIHGHWTGNIELSIFVIRFHTNGFK